MTGRIHAWLLPVLFAACGASHAQAFDASRSRIDFDVRTRIGAAVKGRFPVFDGRVDTLADGRHQVHLRLSARDLVVGDSPRYTRLARGPQLFDSERHPTIDFDSDPYPPALAREGGTLEGRLRMHGVERRERFVLAPAACARPGRECPILATGRVSRDDYGLDGWRWALADRVRFRIDVRFVD
ncbi:YceI family protein [Cognatilysobacter segetis]|uniref:YceI family protein n=1 Tax=Cognatilysobacter segetis TaxID=2492394 RepID=UPI00138FE1FA|nr:YceI family protein [Lysobacter segetis]